MLYDRAMTEASKTSELAELIAMADRGEVVYDRGEREWNVTREERAQLFRAGFTTEYSLASIPLRMVRK